MPDYRTEPPPPLFAPRGQTITPADIPRLCEQGRKVLAATLGKGWLTLAQISAATGAPEASSSARLRSIREAGYIVDRRRVPDGNGLHEYRVTRRGEAK